MTTSYPIRVLHRGMSYNKGGIETYLMNYYRHMDRRLVQFDFIVPEKMTIAYEDEIKKMGGNVYKKIVGVKHHPIRGFTYDRIFFKQHPEIAILHVNDCSAANLRLLKTAKKCGVRTRILHSHNNDYLVPLRKRQLFVEEYNKRHLTEIATDLLACSVDAGKFMFGELPFQIVKNAIEPKKYVFSEKVRQEMRKELGIKSGQTVIGCVARLDHQKNHVFLMKVFAEFKKLDPTSVLVVIGDGPLRDVIENQIRELNLEKSVMLLGMRNDVPSLLNALDIFILPSKSEGLGIVLIEAQCNGLQCVVSDKVPEEPNILGKISYLSLERTAADWANEVYRITTSGNRDRSVDMETVRKAGYDIEIESKKLQDFYLKKVEETLR